MLKGEKIVVVGLGYVGLPLALLAAKKGYQVTGIVKSKKSKRLLNKQVAPFKDVKLSKELKKYPIDVTTDLKKIKKAAVVIICIPTPIDKKNNPDLRVLKDVSKQIGKNLTQSQIIILESTVNPGVSEEIVIDIIEKESRKIVGKDFFYAHCPERVNPGDPKWNVSNIPRVIGAFDSQSLESSSAFYESLGIKLKKVKSLKEVEAAKIVENAFRDINIAFVNELAISFSRLGIDVVQVIDAASTKPFSFMPHYPGAGVGGHCIPVDPYYLINYAKSKGFRHNFLMLARKINNYMPEYTGQLLINALREKNIDLKSAKVLVLGLAYKPEIDDIRESPSLKIIDFLKQQGINPKTYDPYVPSLSSFKNLDEALEFADAVVLTAAHEEFKKMKPAVWAKHLSIIVDGRNALDKEKLTKLGVFYRGIGR